MTRRKPRVVSVFVSALVIVLSAAIAGCGSKTGTVEGKVTVGGQPVSGGTVSFLEADVEEGQKNSIQATINADGIYQAKNVPVGPVKVSIVPPLTTRRKAAAIRPRDREKGVQPKTTAPARASVASPGSIPPKYTKFGTSGLTLTVHGGNNPFDIEMTSKNP